MRRLSSLSSTTRIFLSAMGPLFKSAGSAPRLDAELVAGIDLDVGQRTGGQLEHRGGAPHEGRASVRREVGEAAQHATVGIEKDEVECVAHEKGMYLSTRTEEQAVTRRQRVRPEQPAQPRQDRIGDH